MLFVSEDLVAGNLARTLKNEGHKIKLCILDKGRKNNFNGIVPKVENWKKELTSVKKNGLVVFDSCSHGKIQDELRKKGYSVIGSCQLGNELENDRAYGQEIFKQYGLKTVPLLNFNDIDKAINFVKKNKGKWVVKQNTSGTGLKSLNYVGLLDDGKDVIDILESYKKIAAKTKFSISLQKKIEGVEIAAGRYFNGKDWIGPTEINLEHKKF
ncbi:MAG TPA: hypothetical protein VK255_02290, partial [Patescibacteria group bacterium]|nr:hypothetical protein [Patescibacteria group bacterium]